LLIPILVKKNLSSQKSREKDKMKKGVVREMSPVASANGNLYYANKRAR
jgi:hypothetical protein